LVSANLFGQNNFATVSDKNYVIKPIYVTINKNDPDEPVMAKSERFSMHD